MFFQIVVWYLVLFLLVIMLSVVLLFTAYDNPADIFIIFFPFQREISRTRRWRKSYWMSEQNSWIITYVSTFYIWSIYMTCGYLYIQIDHFSIIFMVNYFIWIRHIGILFRYVTTELHKKLVDANYVCRAIYGLYRSEEIILSKIKSLENMLDNYWKI